MSKEGNAKSSAPKGKPSGTGKESSGLNEAHAVNNEEQDKEIADEYMDETEDPNSNPNIKHPNRNTDKGRENQGDNSTSI